VAKRKDEEPVPGGSIKYEHGKFSILVGPGVTCKDMKVKATYESDPEGFRGFGMTDREAKMDLEMRAFGKTI
jgi:hypothetical protein